MLERELRQSDHLLDGPGAPGSSLYSGVVRHHAHRAPVDPPLTCHDPVSGEVLGEGISEQPVFDETPLVEEQREAVANEEFVLRSELLAAFREVALERPRRRLGNTALIAHRLERIRTRRSIGVGPSSKRSRRKRSR